MAEGEEKGGLLDAFLASADETERESAELEAPETEGALEAQDTEEVEGEAVEAEDDEATEEGADVEGDYVELTNEDGETERVPLDDLIEARKQLNELGSNVSQIRQQITQAAAKQVQERTQRLDQTIQYAEQVYEFVSQLMPKISEPDQSMLDQYSPNYNPQAYREQAEAVRQVREIMQQAQGGMQQAQQRRQAAVQERQSLEMDQHWVALQNADATWKAGDPGKRLTALRTQAASLYGFSPDEIGGIYDHRFVLMAQDALAFRKAQKTTMQAKPKGAAKLVRASAQGKATTSSASKRTAQARQTLKKTGEARDLEGVWGKFI